MFYKKIAITWKRWVIRKKKQEKHTISNYMANSHPFHASTGIDARRADWWIFLFTLVRLVALVISRCLNKTRLLPFHEEAPRPSNEYSTRSYRQHFFEGSNGERKREGSARKIQGGNGEDTKGFTRKKLSRCSMKSLLKQVRAWIMYHPSVACSSLATG